MAAALPARPKRKPQAISIETKKEILAQLDSGTRQCDIAKKYGMSSSTVATILKYRSKIENVDCQPSRKRMRCSTVAEKGEELDEALFKWFKQARSLNIPISGPILLTQADQIATELGIDDFVPSNGWLHRFKGRKGISCKVISGESASVTPESTDEWRTGTIPDLMSRFSPSDIYNVDETGLFYRCLPSRTLALKGEACAGGKKSKERLSVLIGSNLDGSDKLPLLVIGKFQKPRSFNGVRHLPAQYHTNKRAWMTGEIFEGWV